jgi:hypothetical protein
MCRVRDLCTLVGYSGHHSGEDFRELRSENAAVDCMRVGQDGLSAIVHCHSLSVLWAGKLKPVGFHPNYGSSKSGLDVDKAEYGDACGHFRSEDMLSLR